MLQIPSFAPIGRTFPVHVDERLAMLLTLANFRAYLLGDQPLPSTRNMRNYVRS